MLQTLFHIPNELAGWPVLGFGLVLAAWIFVCAGMLLWLVRRQGFNQDTRGYLPVMLIVAAVIAWVLPAISEAAGLPIRGYGAMILLAVTAGMALAAWRARRSGAAPEMVLTLAFWMILPGIVGARAFYVTQKWSEYSPVLDEKGLLALLGAVVNVANGGLVVYGALFGGLAGLVAFWWKYRVPLLAAADLMAPSLILGQAIGRIGCLLNGCCYGGPCEAPWGVSFPWGSPVHVHQVQEGETFLLGLKLADGPRGMPVVREIEPGSPAAAIGLKPDQPIREINGTPVANASDACAALLRADKLHLLARTPEGEIVSWFVDDPPVASTALVTPPGLKIFGLEIAGDDGDRPVVTKVRGATAEAAAGLRAGQVIESCNGRRVATIGQLRTLVATHRTQPEVRINRPGGLPALDLPVPLPLPRARPVHPTQVYSAIDGLLLCLLLLAWAPFQRRDGELFALFLTVHPIARFLIESIRVDEHAIAGTGLHISANISILLLLGAAALWVYILRQPRRSWGVKV